MGSYFPDQGLNLGPVQWKLRVPTTGLLGKCPSSQFKEGDAEAQERYRLVQGHPAGRWPGEDPNRARPCRLLVPMGNGAGRCVSVDGAQGRMPSQAGWTPSSLTSSPNGPSTPPVSRPRMSPGLGVTFKLTASSHPSVSLIMARRVPAFRVSRASGPRTLRALTRFRPSAPSSHSSLCAAWSLSSTRADVRAHLPLSDPSPRL